MSIEKDEDYNKTEDGITLKVKPKLDTISSNTYYTVYKTLMFLSNLLFYKTLGKILLASDFFFCNHNLTIIMTSSDF